MLVIRFIEELFRAAVSAAGFGLADGLAAARALHEFWLASGAFAVTAGVDAPGLDAFARLGEKRLIGNRGEIPARLIV